MTDGVRDDRPTRAALAPLRSPGFGWIYAAGFSFGMARWGLGFLAAYVANDLTGSPRAVQLTGAAMWIPLLFAGAAAGGLADTGDRRRLLLIAIAALVPAVVAIAALSESGQLRVWMLYPLMLVLGVGWVIDITARRTLVLDLVGQDLIDDAMALEALSTAVSLAIGVAFGGAVVEALGVGFAFAGLAGLLVIAAGLVLWSAHQAGGVAPAGTVGGGGADAARSTAGFVEGIRIAAANRGLQSVLGVTLLANFFYFSHTPLVPVFADRLDVGPAAAGLLASATGIGMGVAAIVVMVRRPPRGLAYVGGAVAAMVFVIGLATASRYGVALVAALAASSGFGFFTAAQAVVTMTSVEPELRGRAMGLLSTAIGALPFGMFTLGEVAEAIGPPTAVTIYAICGIVALGVWSRVRGEVLAADR